jgi:3-oxoacyl-[acyl-carrier-protein] synthase III
LPVPIITAVGGYTPPKILTNDDLSQIVETSDAWIVERTGIRERHIADESMATSDLALQAAKLALERRGISAEKLDAILLCTVTPDMLFPSTACLVQHALGAPKAWGFDLVAACSGFLYGLTVGAHLISAGTHRQVLVIGADTMSRILDYTDRSTCVLFGDGAGAFLIEAGDDPSVGFVGHINEIDGAGGEFLKMPAGGSRLPASVDTVGQRLHFVKQEGGQVFKFAVRKLAELCEAILAKYQIQASDVKLLIPHQANKRIILATAERLGLRQDQVIVNLDRYGNTTAATIPLATDDAVLQGRLKKGDLVLFAAVGAGYTSGVNLWRWAY